MILGSSEAVWYLTRASGFVALILLTGSVVLGVLAMARFRTTAWPRFVTQALHRNVSLLAVCFLAAHIATTVLDGFAPIGWLDAVVPFISAYRPIWLGLGAIAVDLTIAIISPASSAGRSATGPGRSCTSHPGWRGRWPCCTASARAAIRRTAGASSSTSPAPPPCSWRAGADWRSGGRPTPAPAYSPASHRSWCPS